MEYDGRLCKRSHTIGNTTSCLTVLEAKSAVNPSNKRITGRPWTLQEEQTHLAMILSQSGGTMSKRIAVDSRMD